MRVTCLLFTLFLSSSVLAQQECRQILKFEIQGHKITEKFEVLYCEDDEERSIVAQYKEKERIITGKQVDRVLKKLANIDPEVTVEDLVKNCGNTERPYIKAFYQMPGQDKKDICLFEKSPSLFQHSYLVKELVYSRSYKEN